MRYSILSKYRTELMGVAILWVMLFHSFDLDMGLTLLEWVRAAGFGGGGRPGPWNTSSRPPSAPGR